MAEASASVEALLRELLEGQARIERRQRRADLLWLTQRDAARRLGLARDGAVFRALLKSGRLRLIPCGSSSRIPVQDVERVAAEGITLEEVERPRVARRGQSREVPKDAAASIRALPHGRIGS